MKIEKQWGDSTDKVTIEFADSSAGTNTVHISSDSNSELEERSMTITFTTNSTRNNVSRTVEIKQQVGNGIVISFDDTVITFDNKAIGYNTNRDGDL